MSTQLTFSGGAGEVTGSNFFLNTGDRRFLIDCGIREREDMNDTRNFDPFPYDTKSISGLLVTHAHADHIGRIPRLVREGFRGVIHSTPATKDLSAIMFDDALRVMQREGVSAALYDESDIAGALSLWKTHEYHESFMLGTTSAQFLDAGHILGSAMVKLSRDGKHVIFTGDLGPNEEPLLNETESPAGADYLIMESVYGDRIHEDRSTRREILRSAIENTRQENGTLLIPSFSLERTQVLLYELKDMLERGDIRAIPVYLDAPLAIRLTDVYRTYVNLLQPSAREIFEKGGDAFAFPGLTLTKETSDSNKIHRAGNPKIIIAGAGMSGGGRIRKHEIEYLPEKHATLLFVGYQAPGSLGRRILDGERKVRIDGEHVKIRAQVLSLSGYSGHKDRDELLEFAAQASPTLKKVFVTMGEPKAALFLAQRLRDFAGLDAVVPQNSETAELDF